ncbi:MAG TPA: MFS transporter, partial [Polyangiales bacterium]
LFAVGSISAALPAGRMSDRHGYHLPVRLSVLLTALGAVLALVSTFVSDSGYPLLCAGALLSGAGANAGLITILRSAGRSTHDVNELKRVFSWMGIAPSLSNFVGPFAAGVCIDQLGFRSAFLLLALSPLLSLAWAKVVPREAQAMTSPARVSAAFDLLSSSQMRRLLLVNWFMSASWDLHSFLVPVLGEERGLSAAAIGTVLGVFALSVTLVRVLIPLAAARLSERQVLSVAMGVVAAALFAYPWTRGFSSMLGCGSVLGLALGSSQPMVMTSLHRITPPERHGQALALRSLVSNASSAVLPLVLSAAGVTLGARGLFWAMALIVGLGVWVARSLESASEN